MNLDERTLQAMLSARLKTPVVPPAEEVWLALSERVLLAPPPVTQRRTIGMQAVFGVVLLLVLTAGLVAASPDIRGWLSGVGVAVGGSPRGITSLYPEPSFTVLQPAALPDGWVRLANGYNPGPDPKGASGWSAVGAARPSVSSAVARRVGGQDISPATSDEAQENAQDMLARHHEAALVLIYADTNGRLIDVLERSAAGKTLPHGEPARVRNMPAVINQQQLTFLEQGTLVEISGSTGRDGWLQLAALLQPTQLAPFETTAAGQAAANATPPARTSMPLSARLGERVTPAASGAEIVRQCGWTIPSTSNTPGRNGLEVRCAARLAGGATDETGGYGYSQSTWRQAAERLGVDPAGGPMDDPQVYLFESDRADGSGSVVVLDATSAEPYLVARLTSVTR